MYPKTHLTAPLSGAVCRCLLQVFLPLFHSRVEVKHSDRMPAVAPVHHVIEAHGDVLHLRLAGRARR